MKTPGAQNVFLRIHPDAQDLILEELTTPAARRKHVQQMSSHSAQIPGSVGERRKMRQELGSMLDQKETETADLGENDGAGRLPAGFCMLTCPVYKWEQLHTTILKSYRPEERVPFLVEDESDVSEKKNSYYRLAVANPGAVIW